MIQIKGRDANELFRNISRELLAQGQYSSPRKLRTLELRDVWLELKNPRKPIVTLPERKLNMEYLKGELRWYFSGSLTLEDIAKYSSFWKKIANTDGTLNSNYGNLILKEQFFGQSQYEWCVKKLIDDRDTRQAILNYNQPKHKYEENHDFVCTIAQLFRTRTKDDNYPNEPKCYLDSTVMMRSNDLIYGLSYDLPWFCLIQKKLAKELNFYLGEYNHFAASLHVYERHFKMVENMAKSS